jgi:type III secretion system FlhB-like substrate exporter
MNNRIKELAKQAGGIGYDDDNKELTPMLVGKGLEKFAELIVRECIKSTLELNDIAIDNEWQTDETFHMIVDNIAEKFEMQYIFRDNKD